MSAANIPEKDPRVLVETDSTPRYRAVAPSRKGEWINGSILIEKAARDGLGQWSWTIVARIEKPSASAPAQTAERDLALFLLLAAAGGAR